MTHLAEQPLQHHDVTSAGVTQDATECLASQQHKQAAAVCAVYS
jgi:hypothetical protein